MTQTNSNNSIRVRERPDCPLCGKPGRVLYAEQRDRLFNAPGQWDVMECQDCQLLWLRTVPIDVDMTKIYPPAQSCTPILQVPTDGGWKTVLLQSILHTTFAYRHLPVPRETQWLGWLAGRLSPLRQKAAYHVNFLQGFEGGKLLDVGCGGGDSWRE